MKKSAVILSLIAMTLTGFAPVECKWLIASPLFAAPANDNLFLTGTVKGIDDKTGIVTIDVKSRSCPGIRQFKVNDIKRADAGLIGRTISFPIDSSTCGDDKIHTMILPAGGK